VLRAGAFAPGATALDSNAAVVQRVANDPQAIGYVSVSDVGAARALAVGEHGTLAIVPNRLTVAKEEYLLSRRLFLYTPAQATTQALDFVRFALSDEGQGVVDANGFVGQKVAPVAPTTDATQLAGAPSEYRTFITGARTLPFSFRFRPGSSELDTKATQDLQRLVAYTQAHGDQQVMLFGFADGSGAAAANLKLSQQRASSVANELRSQGIDPSIVRGFGATLFVDSNDTPEGRERNRRVEVWVR
jgi:phosphate transport system substrate-binding protein